MFRRWCGNSNSICARLMDWLPIRQVPGVLGLLSGLVLSWRRLRPFDGPQTVCFAVPRVLPFRKLPISVLRTPAAGPSNCFGAAIRPSWRYKQQSPDDDRSVIGSQLHVMSKLWDPVLVLNEGFSSHTSFDELWTNFKTDLLLSFLKDAHVVNIMV